MAKNINELAKMIEKMTKQAMQKSNSQVKQTAIKSVQDKTESEIYSYDAKMYERTGKLKKSWISKDTANGVGIANTYEEDNKYILDTVETGEGYNYTGYGYEYEKPRPVVEPAVDELKDGRLTDALKKDMRAIGLNVQ